MRLPSATVGRRLPIMLACTVSLAGCTAVMDGSAARDPGFTPGVVDPTLLNPGNYPITPRPPLGTARDADEGSLLDAQRMADDVTGPWEVDPALLTLAAFSWSPGAMPLRGDPTVITGMFTTEQAAKIDLHGYVNGFGTARKVDKQRQLSNFVLRFTDPATATAAAASMAHAQLSTASYDPRVVPSTIAIPEHPEATAVTYPVPDDDNHLTWTDVDSYMPHGPFVLMQNARVVGPVDVDTNLVDKTLNLQAPAIDTFTPTDPAAFPTLPRDPSGLLARTLPAGKDSQTVNTNVTFGPHGALHYETNPVASGKAYSDAGVDVVVGSDGWVYRARDHAGAATLLITELDTLRTHTTVTDPVPGLPGSGCLKSDDHKYVTCLATADRYLLQVSGSTVKDAHQQAAAQYLMLTAK
jgi:hypothetical protein